MATSLPPRRARPDGGQSGVVAVPPPPKGGFLLETPVTYPPFPAPPLPGTPGTPPPMPFPAPGLPPKDLRQEYVTSTQQPWWLPAKRLTWYIDDLTSEFGDDLYERMLVDPQVSACVNVLKTSIIEDGITLRPPMDEKDDPDYGRASELVTIAERMLDDLTSSFDDVLYDMLDGLALGNRVAELKFELLEEPPGFDGGTLLNLVDIKPKPRHMTAFVVDNYGNVIGVLGLPPYTSPSLLTIDLNVLQSPFLLPRNKFAVYTFRPKSADPRGTSLLRAAYAPWWRKQQIWPEYFRYLTQFGGGALVMKAAPQSSPAFPIDPTTGELIPGGSVLTAEQLLLVAAEQFRNGSAMAVPNGTDVQVVHPPGEGKAFVDAYKMCNLEITKSILLQSLATEEGEHQARAAAEVHQDVMGTLIRQAKKSLQRMIRYDILRPWVLYNWGVDAVDLTPLVSLGTTETQDETKLWAAAAGLMTAQYFAPSQLPAVDEKLGLPIRDLSTMAPAASPGGDILGAGAAPGLPEAGPEAVGVAHGAPGQPNVGPDGKPLPPGAAPPAHPALPPGAAPPAGQFPPAKPGAVPPVAPVAPAPAPGAPTPALAIAPHTHPPQVPGGTPAAPPAPVPGAPVAKVPPPAPAHTHPPQAPTGVGMPAAAGQAPPAVPPHTHLPAAPTGAPVATAPPAVGAVPPGKPGAVPPTGAPQPAVPPPAAPGQPPGVPAKAGVIPPGSAPPAGVPPPGSVPGAAPAAGAPVPPGPKPPPPGIGKPKLNVNAEPDVPGAPQDNPQQQGDPGLSPNRPLYETGQVSTGGPVRQPLEAPPVQRRTPATPPVAKTTKPTTLSRDWLPARAPVSVDFAAPLAITPADLAEARRWAAEILAANPRAGILEASEGRNIPGQASTSGRGKRKRGRDGA